MKIIFVLIISAVSLQAQFIPARAFFPPQIVSQPTVVQQYPFTGVNGQQNIFYGVYPPVGDGGPPFLFSATPNESFVPGQLNTVVTMGHNVVNSGCNSTQWIGHGESWEPIWGVGNDVPGLEHYKFYCNTTNGQNFYARYWGVEIGFVTNRIRMGINVDSFGIGNPTQQGNGGLSFTPGPAAGGPGVLSVQGNGLFTGTMSVVGQTNLTKLILPASTVNGANLILSDNNVDPDAAHTVMGGMWIRNQNVGGQYRGLKFDGPSGLRWAVVAIPDRVSQPNLSGGIPISTGTDFRIITTNPTTTIKVLSQKLNPNGVDLDTDFKAFSFPMFVTLSEASVPSTVSGSPAAFFSPVSGDGGYLTTIITRTQQKVPTSGQLTNLNCYSDGNIPTGTQINIEVQVNGTITGPSCIILSGQSGCGAGSNQAGVALVPVGAKINYRITNPFTFTATNFTGCSVAWVWQ